MPRPKDHAGKDSMSRRATSRAVVGAIPRAYKPPSDVRVPVKNAVPCPDCKAAIGDLCTRADGSTLAQNHSHPARRRMAVRLRNQQLGEH